MVTVTIKPGYKQTEVGTIPAEWNVESIRDVAPLQRGFDLPTKQLVKGKYPVVYSNGILNFHDSFQVKAPGVVTGRSGTIGKVTYVENDYWPHNTTLWVTNFKGNNPKFIYYLFTFLRLERFASGSGVPTLNRNDVHACRIPLPKSYQEQSAIAEVLSDTDELIEQLNNLITRKKNIKQGAMQELLTEKRRLPGFRGKWETKALGELGKFKNGINKGKEDFGHGFPFVNLMDVFGIPTISDNVSFGLVDSSEAERKLFELNEGDVLFVRSSVKPEGVGLTTLVCEDLSNTVFSGFLIRFRDNGQLAFGFKQHCFGLPRFRNRLIASSTVSANTNINQSALKSLQLTFPSDRAEQTAIATVISDMDSEIEELEKRRDKYLMIKKGMMQQLLTGRIRLR